jgi:hypothetical protein
VFGVLVGLAAGLAMAVRLFVPGPIGLADNGDGPSRMCEANLSVHVDHGSTWWFSYVNLRYDHSQPGSCTPDNTYTSSGRWLLELAKPVSHLLGFPGALDLRALALLFCVITAGCFAVFAAALRGRVLLRLLVCALLFVIVGDTAFAAYAASPFSELAGLSGILAATAGAMHLGGSTRARQGGLLLVVLGGVTAVVSKTQALSLLLPFIVLLLVVRVPIGRFTGRLAARALPLLAIVALLLGGLYTLDNQMQAFKEINRTEMLFDGVLPASTNPARSAQELGLPADFAQYTGRNWWGSVAPEKDPRWPQVHGKMTYGNIGRFLAEHPVVTARIALHGLDDYAAAHPDNLGSYPVRAGHPAGTLESRLAVYSTLSRAAGRAVLPTVLALGLFGAFWLRRTRDNPRRSVLIATMLGLVGIALTQFLTAIYAEAIENTKHMVYGVFAGALALVLAAAAALCTPPSPSPAPDQSHG